MVIEQKLFGLLREALWGVSFDETITPEEATELIAIARKQTVAGVVIDMLIQKDIRMERQTLLEAVAFLELVKRQNNKLNVQVANFARMMREAQVDYIVVKGQTLAALYPNPLLRMSGDIDFLVSDYRKAAIIFRDKWSVNLPEELVEKEIAFKHNKVLYELHTYLIDFGLNRHRRYWEQTLTESTPTYVTIDGEPVKVIEPTLYAVYLFIHLFLHFVREGIGLRHLCDWAVMMHHDADKIDHHRLTDVLSKLGLLKAFRAFGSILVDYLGMMDFPFSLDDKDRRMQARILHDVLLGGNFGKNNRKVKRVGLLYKLETMWLTQKNSFRYLPLAPSELLTATYRRVIMNLKIIKV